MILLLAFACAPPERPDWSAGDELNPDVYVAPSDPAGGGGDGDATEAASCADLEGSWDFELTPTLGDCAIPTPLSYSQSLSCGDVGSFTFSSGLLSADCTLSGDTFGCHTPDPSYNFAMTGSFSGDDASGSWSWRFPSTCEVVSGTFEARR